VGTKAALLYVNRRSNMQGIEVFLPTNGSPSKIQRFVTVVHTESKAEVVGTQKETVIKYNPVLGASMDTNK